MNEPEGDQARRTAFNYWLIAILVPVSLGYLSWAGWEHFNGERGILRGAILLFAAAVFSVGRSLEPRKGTTFLKRCVLVVLALGVCDLILHNPGCSIIGLTPRHPDDFQINLTAAREMYGFGRLPYGIQEEFNLPNASISFPFPTYWIYWICSGFGNLDDMLSACTFTAVNLVAAMLLICRSFRLAGMRVAQAEMFWLLLFLSPLWGTILIGQTPVMAAACIVVGWLHARSEDRRKVLLGILLVSFGILIKPNFAPVLLGFALEWWVLGNHRRGMLTLASVVAVALLMIVGTLLVPGGANVETFESFREIAVPRAMSKVDAPNNLSLTGWFIRVFHASVSPSFLALCFGLLLTAFGVWRKLDWRYWFLVPLLISPITWQPYLALALPVQFALVGPTIGLEKTLLILAVGLIGLDVTGVSTFGILLLLWLVIRTSQPDNPRKRQYTRFGGAWACFVLASFCLMHSGSEAGETTALEKQECGPCPQELLLGVALNWGWTTGPSGFLVGDGNDDKVIDAKDLISALGLKRGVPYATPSPTPRTIEVGLPGLPESARGLEFVEVPVGSFLMGSPENERGHIPFEGPQHQVIIEQSFYMQTTEVTQAQWESVTGRTIEDQTAGPHLELVGKGENYPIYAVAVEESEEFINILNSMGLGEFRLPTEAEWEYSCRSGTQTRFYFGDSLECDDGDENCAASKTTYLRSDFMWFSGSPGPMIAQPVGQLKANCFGLYDMHGNVAELCDQIYDIYEGSEADFEGGDMLRVVRGGYFQYPALGCRSAARTAVPLYYRDQGVGFRLVISSDED